MTVPASSANADTTLEQQVLEQLNRVRSNPSAYVTDLQRYRGYYRGKLIVVPGSKADILTDEGVAPVDEAIAFLTDQAQLDTLASSGRLAEAAVEHCADQASEGSVGHVGSDGTMPGDRVRRHGGGEYVSEVITYGSSTAADVVRQLIVDDGVRDRGHRVAIFDGSLRFAGVSCGPHPEYGTMCVVDLAETSDGQPARARYASADQ